MSRAGSYADLGGTPTRNATDDEIVAFMDEHNIRQADLVRFGLAEQGLRASRRRIFRLLRVTRALSEAQRRTADRIDGYDRDDLGESPDF